MTSHHVATGTRCTTHARRGESGAIIILALVFLTVIGLLTGALLGFAWTGTKSLAAYRIERTRRYAADSALQSTVARLTLTANATAGTSPGLTQCGQFPITQYTTGGNIADVVAPNSYVTVYCQTTPGVTVDVIDLDGGQAPRDITMEVRCNYATAMVVSKKLTCGSGANSAVIGRARVRFENRYDQPPTGTVPANARAVVPKILSWQIRN